MALDLLHQYTGGILALFLVSRVVADPPLIVADRANLKRLDYLGLGFLALAMGGMHIMLDKGEENAWFASTFIRSFAAIFMIGAIGFLWQEMRAKDPLINLKLFKYKNFAICTLLMVLVGGLLNATTVLQPQFLQKILGYTATNAGEALTAGGVALLFVMPIAGFATGKFSARSLVLFGFSLFVLAYYYSSTHLTLNMSFGFASWLRILQMLPIPFCFIAITNAAYVGLPKDQSNQVSGIINFVRNIGGSIFIALTGAPITNRGLFHQSRLDSSMNMSNTALSQHLNAMASRYGAITDSATAMHQAQSQIYKQLVQQASLARATRTSTEGCAGWRWE